jgi:hypothetical protein
VAKITPKQLQFLDKIGPGAEHMKDVFKEESNAPHVSQEHAQEYANFAENIVKMAEDQKEHVKSVFAPPKEVETVQAAAEAVPLVQEVAAAAGPTLGGGAGLASAVGGALLGSHSLEGAVGGIVGGAAGGPVGALIGSALGNTLAGEGKTQSDPGGNQTLLASSGAQTGDFSSNEMIKFLRSIDRGMQSVVNDGLKIREGGARIGNKV